MLGHEITREYVSALEILVIPSSPCFKSYEKEEKTEKGESEERKWKEEGRNVALRLKVRRDRSPILTSEDRRER